jgi:hypothetical protein
MFYASRANFLSSRGTFGFFSNADSVRRELAKPRSNACLRFKTEIKMRPVLQRFILEKDLPAFTGLRATQIRKKIADGRHDGDGDAKDDEDAPTEARATPRGRFRPSPA